MIKYKVVWAEDHSELEVQLNELGEFDWKVNRAFTWGRLATVILYKYEDMPYANKVKTHEHDEGGEG